MEITYIRKLSVVYYPIDGKYRIPVIEGRRHRIKDEADERAIREANIQVIELYKTLVDDSKEEG